MFCTRGGRAEGMSISAPFERNNGAVVRRRPESLSASQSGNGEDQIGKRFQYVNIKPAPKRLALEEC